MLWEGQDKLLRICQIPIFQCYLYILKTLFLAALEQFHQAQNKKGIKILKHLMLTWFHCSSEDTNDIVNSCYFTVCMNMHSDFSEMKNSVE